MAIKQEYKDFFKTLNWPDLKIEEDNINTPAGKILELKEKDYILNFYYYNYTEKKYLKKSQPEVICTKDFDIRKIIYMKSSAYEFSRYYLFGPVFNTYGKINKII